MAIHLLKRLLPIFKELLLQPFPDLRIYGALQAVSIIARNAVISVGMWELGQERKTEAVSVLIEFHKNPF